MSDASKAKILPDITESNSIEDLKKFLENLRDKNETGFIKYTFGEMQSFLKINVANKQVFFIGEHGRPMPVFPQLQNSLKEVLSDKVNIIDICREERLKNINASAGFSSINAVNFQRPDWKEQALDIIKVREFAEQAPKIGFFEHQEQTSKQPLTGTPSQKPKLP